MLRLHRKKIVVSAFMALAVFLLGAGAAFASHKKPDNPISYRTDLGQDLDGDHKPETATIRQCGSLYQVNIHFSSGRPKLRLKTHVTEGLAGLSFETTDVDHDNRGDLVITSATSPRPVAVWLNQGRAKFKKAASIYYGGVGKYGGPELHHRSTDQPEPDGTIFLDPLPQATAEVEYFQPEPDSVALLCSQSDLHPSDTLLGQVPPRGPPAAVRA